MNKNNNNYNYNNIMSDEITIIEGEDSSSGASDVEDFMGSIDDLIEKNKFLEANSQELAIKVATLTRELDAAKQRESKIFTCFWFVLVPYAISRIGDYL